MLVTLAIRRLCSASAITGAASSHIIKPSPSLIYPYGEKVTELIGDSMQVFEDYISEEEETNLMRELELTLKKLRYESSHWDHAIASYRETEKNTWKEDNNRQLVDRVRQFIFPKTEKPLALVHILDLAADGEIRPHVDAVRFCGRIIGGLSLLSPSVMRLTFDKDGVKDPSICMDIWLKRRSLYVMRDTARYDFAHAILGSKESFFNTTPVPKSRRVSIIFRCQPKE